jgi:hypothetical protein
VEFLHKIQRLAFGAGRNLYRSMHLNRRNGETLDVFFAAVVGFPGQTIPPAEQVFG